MKENSTWIEGEREDLKVFSQFGCETEKEETLRRHGKSDESVYQQFIKERGLRGSKSACECVYVCVCVCVCVCMWERERSRETERERQKDSKSYSVYLRIYTIINFSINYLTTFITL